MKYEEKFKKISGITMLISLGISILFEILKHFIPDLTKRPLFAEYSISIARNIFLIILGLSFTVFLYLLLKKRIGALKAVFYTLYSDSIIVFFIGAVIMSIASMKNISAVGLTAMESFYYYFLGILIMVISAAVFLLGLIVFAILRSVAAIKVKKQGSLK